MTTKLTKITRKDARKINEAVRKALQGVADEFGLTTPPGGGVSFNDEGVSGRFQFSIKTEGGVPADFTRNCGRFGLKPEHFGAEFKSGRDTFRITGIKTRRPKYPVSATRVKDGRSYKFTAQQVLHGLPDGGANDADGLTVGDRVSYTNPFHEVEIGTVEGYLGQGRVRLLLTTGETRTPKASECKPVTGKRDEDDILDDIDRVYGNLSPENLTCDGECSRSEVARRSAAYNRALRALFKELGREVTEEECYERFRQQQANAS